MPRPSKQPSWLAYRDEELSAAAYVLPTLGIDLDHNQVHLHGERFLVGVRKLTLTGARKRDGARVVAKISSRPDGQAEIEREHHVRSLLDRMSLSSFGVMSPSELLYVERDGFLVSATAYIGQELPFNDRSPEEQLSFGLRGLNAQESIRVDDLDAAAVETLGVNGADFYLASSAAYARTIRAHCTPNRSLEAVLDAAIPLFAAGAAAMQPYLGFVTHSDYVPHNFRISNGRLYLLDHAAVYCGNKQESWARFINNMMFRNRFVEYEIERQVRNSGGAEAAENLRIMRIYKVLFSLQLSASALSLTEGTLHVLSEKRVAFWTKVLEMLVAGEPIQDGAISAFLGEVHALRSPDEWRRRASMQ